MIISDQQREENYQEYLRLLKDPNYYDVSFDEKSGGVSAVHKEHRFDKSMGPYGIKRGDYEVHAIEALRRAGYLVVLTTETTDVGTKQFDGFINCSPMEIKAVEGNGRWSIRTKIYDAAMQGADVVVLQFLDKEIYNPVRVAEGWKMYEDARLINKNWPAISKVLIVSEQEVSEMTKPPW